MPRRRAGVVPDAADSLFVAPDDAISESVLRQARGRRLSHFLNQPVTNFCLLDGLLVPLQIREVLREIPRKLLLDRRRDGLAFDMGVGHLRASTRGEARCSRRTVPPTQP